MRFWRSGTFSVFCIFVTRVPTKSSLFTLRSSLCRAPCMAPGMAPAISPGYEDPIINRYSIPIPRWVGTHTPADRKTSSVTADGVPPSCAFGASVSFAIVAHFSFASLAPLLSRLPARFIAHWAHSPPPPKGKASSRIEDPYVYRYNIRSREPYQCGSPHNRKTN